MPGSRCQPANGWFVLVAGWPGSGKSTLAAALAAELGLPLLAKDEIKEALVDGLGRQKQQPPPSASAGPQCWPC
jgi:predicted kinase